MKRDIETLSEITDDDCVYYTGEQLKWFTQTSTGFHQLSIETIKNGLRDERIYNPYNQLEDGKKYKCYECSRVSGAGIEYNYIYILNY